MKNATKLVRYFTLSTVIVALVGIFGATQSNAQFINEILKRMDGNFRALKSLRSNVTMVKVNPQIGSRDISIGNSTYLAKTSRDPRYVRIEWIKPTVELLIIRGDEYQLYRPTLKVAYFGNTSAAKDNGVAGGVLGLMNMSKVDVQASYMVQYVGEETVKGGIKTWHILLTPKKSASFRTADIWVDQNGMSRQTTVTEKSDDVTTVLLENIEPNVKVNMSIFSFNLPSGTKKLPV